MYIIRFFITAVFLLVPALAQAEVSIDNPWRLGIGAGAFSVTVNVTNGAKRYQKVLPAYQASISYNILADTAHELFLPNLEAGLLVSGGKRGSVRKGATTVRLEMPTLLQVFARVSSPLDRQWDVYGMLSLGVLHQKVWNNVNTLLTNNRVAALGVGGGFSRNINKSCELDLGVFMPGIVLSKGNKGLSQRAVGVILNFRYAL